MESPSARKHLDHFSAREGAILSVGCTRGGGGSIAKLPQFCIVRDIEFYACLAAARPGTSKTTLESRKSGAVVAQLNNTRRRF